MLNFDLKEAFQPNGISICGCSSQSPDHLTGKNEVYVFYILEPILTTVFVQQKVLIHWGFVNRNRLA